jgi:hypothetical protein
VKYGSTVQYGPDYSAFDPYTIDAFIRTLPPAVELSLDPLARPGPFADAPGASFVCYMQTTETFVQCSALRAQLCAWLHRILFHHGSRQVAIDTDEESKKPTGQAVVSPP